MRGQTPALLCLCAVLATLSPLSALAGSKLFGDQQYRYGVCLKEAAEHAIYSLNSSLPDEGPYKIGQRFSEYDELKSGVWENTFRLRSFIPMGGKKEQITWVSKHRTITVTTHETEKGCEAIDVEISPYYN